MKNLVMYHDHCTDGFGAAFAAWLALGEEDTEYLPVNYGQIKTMSDLGNLPKNPLHDNTTIYILDFSLPKDVMEILMGMKCNIVWLDHHKTAFEMWTGKYAHGDHYVENSSKHKIILDDNKSGAMLAWEHFFSADDVPMMIQHIDDRDRWQFKLAGTKEFHAYMASRKPWSFMMWDDIINAMEIGINDDDVYREGAAILRAHEQNVKTIVDVGIRDCQIIDEFDGTILRGKAANCPPQFASDVGHELANRSETYGLCWYMGRDGKIKCSLRSNGEYDVSAIAKSFGGGGHRNAAGFETTLDKLLSWLP